MRRLQLAGSLLCFAAVPLRPQLERALRLPAGSLAHDPGLVSELTALLLEHHLSPDLLASEDLGEVSTANLINFPT